MIYTKRNRLVHSRWIPEIKRYECYVARESRIANGGFDYNKINLKTMPCSGAFIIIKLFN